MYNVDWLEMAQLLWTR